MTASSVPAGSSTPPASTPFSARRRGRRWARATASSSPSSTLPAGCSGCAAPRTPSWPATRLPSTRRGPRRSSCGPAGRSRSRSTAAGWAVSPCTAPGRSSAASRSRSTGRSSAPSGTSGETTGEDEWVSLAGAAADFSTRQVPALTRSLARLAAEPAGAQATVRGVAPVVAVVDAGGDLVYLWRPDAAQVASVGVATDKAHTAALFRRPSKDFEDQASGGRPSALHLAGAVPLQGGMPITVDGHVVGAVGVSGASSADEDQELSVLGQQAAEDARSPGRLRAAVLFPRQAVRAQVRDRRPVARRPRGYKVDAGRREAPGEVEYHEDVADIMHVVEGKATVVTGASEPRASAASPGIDGGTHRARRGGRTRGARAASRTSSSTCPTRSSTSSRRSRPDDGSLALAPLGQPAAAPAAAARAARTRSSTSRPTRAPPSSAPGGATATRAIEEVDFVEVGSAADPLGPGDRPNRTYDVARTPGPPTSTTRAGASCARPTRMLRLSTGQVCFNWYRLDGDGPDRGRRPRPDRRHDRVRGRRRRLRRGVGRRPPAGRAR